MYIKTTNNIKVIVLPQYLDEQSEPDENRYIWAYTIQVENHGEKTIQLRNRYWHITDAMGQIQEVRGEGVVGEQPVLKPGEAFRYTSGVPLHTPSGMMVGEYEMEMENGERLPSPSPPSPSTVRSRHIK